MLERDHANPAARSKIFFETERFVAKESNNFTRNWLQANL